MTQLNNHTLTKLPKTVKVPQYSREKLKIKMVHLGFGAFHRAHQAIYTELLANEHDSDWGYCEVNLIGGEQQIIDLKNQDYLYTVSEMSPKKWNTCIIGVVKQALHLEIDGLEPILKTMVSPDIAIVSLTITEKGYFYEPATGKLLINHPIIQHDISNPSMPKSAAGLIIQALRLRKRLGLSAFSVMSCDNIPENGLVIKNVILQLATLQEPEFVNWITKNVTFPSTMVDRIVPAITEDSLSKIESQLGGIKDPVSIACEPYRQWVIEDDFVNGRPQWEKVGAELVHDVLPYEEMKLRMLNGSHSFLAYLGYLAGYQFICDCMQDEDYYMAARKLMLNQQAPTLSVKGKDLSLYADLLLNRFKNPEIKHKTSQIAIDGSQKLPQRMLDSIRWHISHKSNYDLLALGIAGWMRYVGGIDDNGQPIAINDPLAKEIASKVSSSLDGKPRVKALLELESIFGKDLSNNFPFVESVEHAYLLLMEKGAKQTIHRFISN